MSTTEPTTPRRGAGDQGASLVEYALLVAFIAVLCLGALSLFGVTNGGSVNHAACSLAGAEQVAAPTC